MSFVMSGWLPTRTKSKLKLIQRGLIYFRVIGHYRNDIPQGTTKNNKGPEGPKRCLCVAHCRTVRVTLLPCFPARDMLTQTYRQCSPSRSGE